MRYENEKCPLCGKAFAESDDIVVCPECATPHHRDCYTELGKCVNEHKHQDGFVWTKTEEKPEEKAEVAEENEQSDFVKCPECGTKNKKNALVCANCATVLNPEIRQQFEPPETSNIYIDGQPISNGDFIDEENTVTVKEAVCFIQKGKESYIKTFIHAKLNKRKPKFNFFAFIFGAYWFFFRKMYKPGFAFAGIDLGINIFSMSFSFRIFGDAMRLMMEHATEFTQGTADAELINQWYALIETGILNNRTALIMISVLNLVSLLVHVFIGFKANGYYLNFIKDSIGKIKNVTPHPGAYYTYLYAKGGVSFLNPVLISIAIYYLNEMILSYAFM